MRPQPRANITMTTNWIKKNTQKRHLNPHKIRRTCTQIIVIVEMDNKMTWRIAYCIKPQSTCFFQVFPQTLQWTLILKQEIFALCTWMLAFNDNDHLFATTISPNLCISQILLLLLQADTMPRKTKILGFRLISILGFCNSYQAGMVMNKA